MPLASDSAGTFTTGPSVRHCALACDEPVTTASAAATTMLCLQFTRHLVRNIDAGAPQPEEVALSGILAARDRCVIGVPGFCVAPEPAKQIGANRVEQVVAIEVESVHK